MNFQELISIRGTAQTVEIDILLDWYWQIELSLSDEYGNSYSSVEDFQDSSWRECRLCGTVGHTNEHGRLDKCRNDKCQQIREYFKIPNFPMCERYGAASGKIQLRTAYLKARIVKLGYQKLSEIPKEILFTFLFSVMLERMQHEANN